MSINYERFCTAIQKMKQSVKGLYSGWNAMKDAAASVGVKVTEHDGLAELAAKIAALGPREKLIALPPEAAGNEFDFVYRVGDMYAGYGPYNNNMWLLYDGQWHDTGIMIWNTEYKCITMFRGKYYLVRGVSGNDGGVWVSEDKATWTSLLSKFPSNSPEYASFRSVGTLINAGDKLIALSRDSVFCSEDGENWSCHYHVFPDPLQDSMWGDCGGGKIALMNQAADIYMADMDDLDHWTAVEIPREAQGNVFNIQYVNGTWFIGVLGKDFCLYSTDLVNLNKLRLCPGDWQYVAYLNGVYAICACDGIVALSTDLTTWQFVRKNEWYNDLYCISSDGRQFITSTMSDGRIYTSPDGVNWTLVEPERSREEGGGA